jgi:hypothetical protein
MERSFYNEDFEELLKQKADQYKMYPSDKVWKGINNSLHSRRKWYWIGFALLFTSMGYYGIQTLLTPSKAIDKNTSSGQQSSADPAADHSIQKTQPSSAALLVPFPLKKSGNTGSSTGENIQKMAGPLIIAADNSTGFGSAVTVQPVNEVPASATIIELYSSFRPVRNDAEILDGTSNKEADLKFITPGFSAENKSNKVQPHAAEIAENADGEKLAKDMTQTSDEAGDSKRINWLQEFALHELTIPRTKRVSWLIAFSPTINFRKLTGNNNAQLPSEVKNVPMALNIEGDLNKLVNHKPALGFELGSHMLYAINKDVTVKAGLQFNYSRYVIQAFSTYRSDVATIALNTIPHRNGDSLHSLTRISNFGGDVTKDIQNQYFQLSAPVGLEYRLIGNKRLQIFLAGTIQPTYLMNRNSYLITTDYKNYTREPSLVRRWNINTSAEAFVSYKTGGVRWQVGPQFRYQMLSSYSNEYPIKEYLIEYGIKIGVSKTIR